MRLRSLGASFLDAGPSGGGAHDVPQHLRRHAVAPDPAGLVDRVEHRAARDGGRGGPRVDVVLHPRGDRHRSHVSAFADEIRNHPVLLTLLNRLNVQRQQLGAAEATANQHGDHRLVSQLARVRRVVASRSRRPCSGVSQLPRRTPMRRTPFTRRIPAASSGLKRPPSAASYAMRRTAANRRLIVAGA